MWRGPLSARVEGADLRLRYAAVHAHYNAGRYPWHRHPYTELLLAVAGAGHVETASDLDMSARIDTVMVLPAFMPHATRWRVGRGGWQLFVMDFDLRVDAYRCPLEAGESVDPGFGPFYEWFIVRRQPELRLPAQHVRVLQTLIAGARDRMVQGGYGIGTEMLTLFMRVVAVISSALLARKLANGRKIFPPQDSAASALLHARTEMENRVQFDPGAIRRWARLAGYSEAHFVRAFRSAFGVTPKHYAQRLLMRRACALLETSDLPVRGIAQRLGYDEASTFSRAFRRFVGESPEAYRLSRSAEG